MVYLRLFQQVFISPPGEQSLFVSSHQTPTAEEVAAAVDTGSNPHTYLIYHSSAHRGTRKGPFVRSVSFDAALDLSFFCSKFDVLRVLYIYISYAVYSKSAQHASRCVVSLDCTRTYIFTRDTLYQVPADMIYLVWYMPSLVIASQLIVVPVLL